MRRQSQMSFSHHRQRGVALAIGLVLLVILTLLAIAGMSTSVLELQMSGNTQYAEKAFQTSETGIEIAISSGQAAPDLDVVLPPVTVADGQVSYLEIAYPDYGGRTNPIPKNRGKAGSSVGEQVGFVAYHFDITSTGTSARNATATHTQSFYIISPPN